MSESPTEEMTSSKTEVPDAAVVSLVDAVSHALDTKPLQPIPPPLPTGWVMRESRSQPNYYYYYNMESGEATWISPIVPQHQPEMHPDEDQAMTDATMSAVAEAAAADASATTSGQEADNHHHASRKRSHEESAPSSSSSGHTPTKKSKSSGKPSKVRILHILKKHKDSRRPSSWRQAKITATKEEAREELQGLLELLQEETGEDQRATFEELARTESDCSSAKRGGDLGFFGPKKMQPAFEEASFALEIGELSGIVETSSGVHVLLRIG